MADIPLHLGRYFGSGIHRVCGLLPEQKPWKLNKFVLRDLPGVAVSCFLS